MNVTGLPIPSSINEDEMQELKEFEKIKNSELEGIILEETTDARFRRAFVLYALSIFLCPTSKNSPSQKLLGAIMHIDRVREFNWSMFVFECLMSEVRKYKLQTKKQSIGGCMFFLMVCSIS